MSKAEDSIVKRMVDATNETVRLRAQLAVFVARDTVEAENIGLKAENKHLRAALVAMEQWAVHASDQYPASKWAGYVPEAVIQARAALSGDAS